MNCKKTSENESGSNSNDPWVAIEWPWLSPNSLSETGSSSFQIWGQFWGICEFCTLLGLDLLQFLKLWFYQSNESRYCLYKIICEWELHLNSKYNKSTVFRKFLTLYSPQSSFEARFPAPFKNISKISILQFLSRDDLFVSASLKWSWF